jgi:hypothetical protein
MKWYFPIIVNYQLPYSYKQILASILEEEKYQLIDDFRLTILNQHPNQKIILNNVDFEQLKYLNEHHILFYLFTPIDNNTQEFKKKLIESSISNVIFLSKPTVWILPELKIEQNNKIFIQFLNRNFIIKSLFKIGGYKTIFINEINTLLLFLKENSTSFEEIVLLIDLDISFDLDKFLYELNTIAFNDNILKDILHLVFIKDINKKFLFSLPNFIQLKNRFIHLPIIKRIFSPKELMIFLIESLIFYKRDQKILYDNFFSFREILYGNIALENILSKKKNIFLDLIERIQDYKKALPILWLYEYLIETTENIQSIVLK